jgi:tryptophan 5-monooxygenase
LCKQPDGSFKVYGAGLLSSVAELQHAIAATDKIKKFDLDEVFQEECVVTSYQNSYFWTDSFEEAKEKLRFQFNWKLRDFMFTIHNFL